MFELVRNLVHQHEQVVPVSMFVALLCLCLVIGHLLEENRWVNESITAIIIISGEEEAVLSELYNHHAVRSDSLHEVYSKFMDGTLVLGSWWLFPRLGFGGLTAREYLAVGTIFSSTDTVCTLQVLHQDENPLLYSLVFGEGVVNDATSVVLFNAIQQLDVSRINSQTFLKLIGDFIYLFSTSTALGVSFGLVTAYLLKTLYFGRHSTVRELAIMVLMAYLSYMLAELLVLSGILTVFFCGILMSHYAWHIFAMMSFVAETFIFLYVGMDALDMEKWKMTRQSLGTLMASFSTLVFLILLGRAAFVFPLSVVSNYMNRRPNMPRPLTFKHQVVIWWAGLMRGAVSIALAFKQFTFSGVTWDPVSAAMITNTIIVVLFTTLVFGFLTKPLILCLLPRVTDTSDGGQGSKSPKEDLTLPLLSSEESATSNVLRAKNSLSMLIGRPVYTVHFYWRKFDDKYMRPIFGGPRSSLPEC
ncbi:hypothetical protein V6N13_085009 [Hibiscus sabdariffa]|uniref:Cation/H+ exchanger transmembrane domain-containing protein n=1 Tax=Hibiscus sabdariffa TaxID=183260 RepID=A0ABR2D080_9ROSI